MQALSMTHAGERHTIKWMFGVPEVLEFMRSRDVKEGSTVRIVQKFGGGMIISTGNTRLAIDGKIADRIQV